MSRLTEISESADSGALSAQRPGQRDAGGGHRATPAGIRTFSSGGYSQVGENALCAVLMAGMATSQEAATVSEYLEGIPHDAWWTQGRLEWQEGPVDLLSRCSAASVPPARGVRNNPHRSDLILGT